MNVLQKMVLLPEKEYITMKNLRPPIEKDEKTILNEIPSIGEKEYKQSIVDEIAKFEAKVKKKNKKIKKQEAKPIADPSKEWEKLPWTSVKNF